MEIALVVASRHGTTMPPVAVERGTASGVAMPVAQVLRIALACGGDGVVVAHNHPRGHAPGPADLAVTRRLVAACATVGITLNAHLVLTTTGWYDCAAAPIRHTRWADAAA